MALKALEQRLEARELDVVHVSQGPEGRIWPYHSVDLGHYRTIHKALAPGKS